jgi:hypothetical protein
MHSWQGGVGILTTMTMATTTAGERVDSDEDNNTTKTTKARSIDLIFDTTTNLWSDAFLAGRGGNFDNDDEGLNDHKDNDNDGSERGQQ